VKRTGVLSLQIITSTCKEVPSSCIGLTGKSGEEDRSPFIAESCEEDRSPFTADNYFYMQRSPLLLHRFNKEEW